MAVVPEPGVVGEAIEEGIGGGAGPEPAEVLGEEEDGVGGVGGGGVEEAVEAVPYPAVEFHGDVISEPGEAPPAIAEGLVSGVPGQEELEGVDDGQAVVGEELGEIQDAGGRIPCGAAEAAGVGVGRPGQIDFPGGGGDDVPGVAGAGGGLGEIGGVEGPGEIGVGPGVGSFAAIGGVEDVDDAVFAGDGQEMEGGVVGTLAVAWDSHALAAEEQEGAGSGGEDGAVDLGGHVEEVVGMAFVAPLAEGGVFGVVVGQGACGDGVGGAEEGGVEGEGGGAP